ncbi:hypothetical protein BCR33DRAFT_713702 [Rhizoclosmatium globosum]|uniref:F-box domain-containing protein n=1 Tax=Rhizoclosmatium globosum TaxID=329046 RepID=A0A1Y2CQN9_9FUNG|nr:hypothetical protein BCR33DRAFT_713702 [Rhizoclosmatium globosum]|eukprot:ORY49342.1 hypothetical protein BCR33DRAFT_713702 [Rhizoclosmatium globosum]
MLDRAPLQSFLPNLITGIRRSKTSDKRLLKPSAETSQAIYNWVVEDSHIPPMPLRWKGSSGTSAKTASQAFHIPSRAAKIKITQLSSKLILRILSYAVVFVSDPCVFQQICKKFHRAFNANPALADEMIWKILVQRYADLSEDMPTVRHPGESWKDVMKLWFTSSQLSLGSKASSHQYSSNSTLHCSSTPGTLSTGFVFSADIVDELPKELTEISALLGPCKLVDGRIYYIQESAAGGGERDSKLMVLCPATGNGPICVSDFPRKAALFSGSFLNEPAFALCLRNTSRTDATSESEDTIVLGLDADSLCQDSHTYLFKNTLVLAQNQHSDRMKGRPVIDARYGNNQTPFSEKPTTLSVFQLSLESSEATGGPATLLRNSYAPETAIMNPCCNEFKNSLTVRDKLMNALKSDRATSIRIQQIPTTSFSTLRTRCSRPSTKRHYSFSDFTDAGDDQTNDASLESSSTASSSTASFFEDEDAAQGATLDLSQRNLHIHGISLTRFHMIVVSTKFQPLNKDVKGGECLVKVVLSVYSLKTLLLVTEMFINELSFTQRNRLFGKVKVGHTVCGAGKKVWIWLEGVELGGTESRNPLMTGSGGECEIRPEVACIDVYSSSLKVYERKRKEGSSAGKQPWIKWRRGLEVHGNCEKGAWVFFKQEDKGEEQCCWLKLC